MGLLLTLPTENGVPANYWRINDIAHVRSRGIYSMRAGGIVTQPAGVKVTLGGYPSEGVADTTAPLKSMQVVLDSGLYTGPDMSLAAIYTAVKTMPPWDGATDA